MNASCMRSLLAAALAFPVAHVAYAHVSPLVNYQGYVEIDGQAVADQRPTNYRAEFYVYDAPSGGNVIWAEVQTITVFRGVFNTLLGNGDAISLDANNNPVPPRPSLVDAFSDEGRWLTFRIPALSAAEFGVRQQVVSTPQALVAQRVVESSVNSSSIADNTVESADIKNGTIVQADLAIGSVNSAAIIDGAIIGADIADRTIGGIKMIVGTVGSTELLDGNVNTIDLANGAVTSDKIADGQVTSADIANGTIVQADMAIGSINSAAIIDGAVTGADILDRTITWNDIATSSIGSAEIIDGTLSFWDTANLYGMPNFWMWTLSGRRDGANTWQSGNWITVTNGAGVINSILIYADKSWSDRAVQAGQGGIELRIDGTWTIGPLATRAITHEGPVWSATGNPTNIIASEAPMLSGFNDTGLQDVFMIAPFIRYGSKVEIRNSVNTGHVGVQLGYHQ